jgi:hypothetical protein
MPTLQAVEGLQFNHLIIIRRLPKDPEFKSRATRVLARCKCGSEKPYFLALLKAGNTKSCGCPGLDPRRSGLDVHVRENGIWRNLKQRCLNPNSPHYANFGGSGLTMCARWTVFKHFFEDMGECPVGMGLGRRDPSSGYDKENCIWKTRKDLARERRAKFC